MDGLSALTLPFDLTLLFLVFIFLLLVLLLLLSTRDDLLDGHHGAVLGDDLLDDLSGPLGCRFLVLLLFLWPPLRCALLPSSSLLLLGLVALIWQKRKLMTSNTDWAYCSFKTKLDT